MLENAVLVVHQQMPLVALRCQYTFLLHFTTPRPRRRPPKSKDPWRWRLHTETLISRPTKTLNVLIKLGSIRPQEGKSRLQKITRVATLRLLYGRRDSRISASVQRSRFRKCSTRSALLLHNTPHSNSNRTLPFVYAGV